MDDDNARAGITEFVAQYLNTDEVDPQVDMFATGMVNSLFAMQLVLFVENRFGLAVDNEDLDYQNFCSIDAICDFVARKRGAAAG